MIKKSIIVVGLVIFAFLPLPLIDFFPPGQITENHIVDSKFNNIDFRSLMKLQSKDCGYNDPIDVGPGCYYVYSVANVTDIPIFIKALKTKITSAGYEITSNDPDQLTVSASGKKLFIFIELFPGMDYDSENPPTIIKTVIVEVNSDGLVILP